MFLAKATLVKGMFFMVLTYVCVSHFLYQLRLTSLYDEFKGNDTPKGNTEPQKKWLKGTLMQI